MPDVTPLVPKATVVADDPLYDPPVRPVPMVRLLRFDPKDTPEMVLLVKAELGILVRVLVEPEILLLVSV